MTGLWRALLVSVLALASVGSLQAGTRGHVQDDAKLFGDEALTEANSRLFDLREKTRVAFWLRTVKNLPDEVLTALKAKKTGEQAVILANFARETAGKDGMTGVYALIIDDPRYLNNLVIDTNAADARVLSDSELNSIRNILVYELKRSPDTCLLHVVDRVEDSLLRRSGDSSISWPMLGAALAGLAGLWLLLRAIRMRAAVRSGQATTSRRPNHVGGLFGGLFGVVAGHWIYDTLFEQEKNPAAELAPGQNPLDAPLELKQSETADAP